METIDLSPGKYEVYYAVSPRGHWESRYRDVGDFLDDLFDGFQGSKKWRRDADEWGIELDVDDSDRNNVRLENISIDEEAIVQLAPVGDDEYYEEGFSLNRRARVRVYAIGEGEDGDMFDYGWIIDGNTRRTVWEMDYRSTRWAGGAEKNRIIDEEIILPSGSYIVYFVTDGSHSYDDWNQLPPYDIRHWGITLWGAESGFDRDREIQPFQKMDDRDVVVDLSRVGNDRFEKDAFTLKRPADVRILCVGEYTSGGGFSDYGWILNARTRETVWEMDRRNTRHAGGARKNRMFDGIVSLEQGNYEVFYITDGSHGYRRWNAGPPYNPEAWGITIWGSGSDFNSNWVSRYEAEEDPDVLVQILRVGDHERVRRRFQLDRSTRVRIYALGEGDDDEMYDYGWIEDDRGRRVWRMRYWDTEHAGGGRKNRFVNEFIRLESGEYTVHYRSDGSHSYDDWNTDPPHDPVHWGITVWIDR